MVLQLGVYTTGNMVNLTLPRQIELGTTSLTFSSFRDLFRRGPKFLLSKIKLDRSKDNLSHKERHVLGELSRDRNIVVEKADKGTAAVNEQ